MISLLINFISAQSTLVCEIPRDPQCNPSVVNIRVDRASLRYRSPCRRPVSSPSCIDRSTFDSEKIFPDPHRSECDIACWDLDSSRFSAPRSRPLSDTAPKPVNVNLLKSFPRQLPLLKIKQLLSQRDILVAKREMFRSDVHEKFRQSTSY